MGPIYSVDFIGFGSGFTVSQPMGGSCFWPLDQAKWFDLSKLALFFRFCFDAFFEVTGGDPGGAASATRPSGAWIGTQTRLGLIFLLWQKGRIKLQNLRIFLFLWNQGNGSKSEGGGDLTKNFRGSAVMMH
jgi:hypothetical protein